jgi:hypothetical protein
VELAAADAGEELSEQGVQVPPLRLGEAGKQLPLVGEAGLDRVGIAGTLSMAAGAVLTKRWGPPVPVMAFTGWNLAFGRLLLLPFAGQPGGRAATSQDPHARGSASRLPRPAARSGRACLTAGPTCGSDRLKSKTYFTRDCGAFSANAAEFPPQRSWLANAATPTRFRAEVTAFRSNVAGNPRFPALPIGWLAGGGGGI